MWRPRRCATWLRLSLLSNHASSLRLGLLLVMFAGLCGGTWWLVQQSSEQQWSDEELLLVRSLWLGSLPELPADPTNRVGDDAAAARLGHRLFFDTRLSANGGVSCATCHQPDRPFTDGLALGQGLATGRRNTMGLIGTAYSPWYFWDGRKDSQWSQALGPLENHLEHGGNRLQLVRTMSEDAAYASAYQRIFGPLPDIGDTTRFPASASPLGDETAVAAWTAMHSADQHAVNQVFANMGKALAAYQRLLQPGPAPFDVFAEKLLAGQEADGDLSGAAQAGLKLFIGKASCINCHNGPLLTNNEFHNTGVLPAPGQLPGMGRSEGIRLAHEDPFNCLGAFSDDPNACAELRYAKVNDEVLAARRTPSLRNVAETAPYMHAGQLATLEAVLNHYNAAVPALVGHNEAKPLNLRPAELRMLEAFLQALTGPIATDPKWLAPPEG